VTQLEMPDQPSSHLSTLTAQEMTSPTLTMDVMDYVIITTSASRDRVRPTERRCVRERQIEIVDEVGLPIHSTQLWQFHLLEDEVRPNFASKLRGTR
jgi:hypothetical protein